MTRYLVVVTLVVSLCCLVTTEAKKQKNKRVFDPSKIFHALTAEEDASVDEVPDFDKVYEYTKEAAPTKGHNGGKNRKKNKKKHKKRHAKGSSKQKQSKTCCENGGLCVMGAFCHCPSGFEGRYCEHEVKTRDCGPVKHEEVFRQGCTMCRCIDGVLHCLPGVYSDCEDGQIEPIFYNFNEEVKPTASGRLGETPSEDDLNKDTLGRPEDPIWRKLSEMEEEERQMASSAIPTTSNLNILPVILSLWTFLQLL